MDQEAINQLRQPHPDQGSVDARSASLLRRSDRYRGRTRTAGAPTASAFGLRQAAHKKPVVPNQIH